MNVDFHVHIGWIESFAWNLKGRVKADIGDLLAYMDEADVDWAVASSAPVGFDRFSEIVSNEELLKLTMKTGGRLVPFCAVDPRAHKATERFERLVKMGCKGLGEFKSTSEPMTRKSLRCWRRLRNTLYQCSSTWRTKSTSTIYMR